MRIAVVGGGVGGLTTGMLLARDGHDVVLLERDPSPPPAPDVDPWDTWERHGVNQFRLIHYFLPRFRQLLDAELPDVATALQDAGGLTFNILDHVPVEMSAGRREGDDRFTALTGRRPVVEAVLARAAADTAGLQVRRAVSVQGLLTGSPGPDGVPHVIGVRTDDGEEITADLVVDAGGRRSALPSWLAPLGGPAPLEELEDSGFTYYNRHFRSDDGSTPAMFGPILAHYGSVSVLTLPADNGTWGIGIIVSAKDAAMRGLRDTEAWTRVASAFPLSAHWLEGEPLHEVTSISKVEDRHRTYVIDGTPVATGVVAVADAWACTNPSVGRGSSIGLLHAIALRDVLREHGAEASGGIEQAFHLATLAEAEGWYRSTLAFDRHRLAEIEAAIAGEPYEPDDHLWEVTKAASHGAGADPDLFRTFLATVGLIERIEDVLQRPGVEDAFLAAGAGWRDAPVLGPDRAELVQLVSK